MKRLTVVTGFAMALVASGCAPDPGSQQLTPEFLEDRDRMSAVANRLSPEDRQAFGAYVTGRQMVGALGAEPLVMADGSDPSTVAEAVALQKWAAALALEYDTASAPHSAVMANRGVGLSTEQYNTHVHALNALRDDYQAKLDAGPPADLMSAGR